MAKKKRMNTGQAKNDFKKKITTNTEEERKKRQGRHQDEEAKEAIRIHLLLIYLND
jgi:hypothetical protein